MKRSVLIVCGNSSLKNLVRANLEARGYDTLLAVESLEAIRIVESESPDLVIIDGALSDGNGMELCRRIRSTQGVLVIMLANLDYEENVVEAFEAGADDVIPEPFSLQELIARVKALLRRKDMHETNPSPQPGFGRGKLVIDFAERRES